MQYDSKQLVFDDFYIVSVRLRSFPLVLIENEYILL